MELDSKAIKNLSHSISIMNDPPNVIDPDNVSEFLDHQIFNIPEIKENARVFILQNLTPNLVDTLNMFNLLTNPPIYDQDPANKYYDKFIYYLHDLLLLVLNSMPDSCCWTDNDHEIVAKLFHYKVCSDRELVAVGYENFTKSKLIDNIDTNTLGILTQSLHINIESDDPNKLKLHTSVKRDINNSSHHHITSSTGLDDDESGDEKESSSDHDEAEEESEDVYFEDQVTDTINEQSSFMQSETSNPIISTGLLKPQPRDIEDKRDIYPILLSIDEDTDISKLHDELVSFDFFTQDIIDVIWSLSQKPLLVKSMLFFVYNSEYLQSMTNDFIRDILLSFIMSIPVYENERNKEIIKDMQTQSSLLSSLTIRIAELQNQLSMTTDVICQSQHNLSLHEKDPISKELKYENIVVPGTSKGTTIRQKSKNIEKPIINPTQYSVIKDEPTIDLNPMKSPTPKASLSQKIKFKIDSQDKRSLLYKGINYEFQDQQPNINCLKLMGEEYWYNVFDDDQVENDILQKLRLIN